MNTNWPNRPFAQFRDTITIKGLLGVVGTVIDRCIWLIGCVAIVSKTFRPLAPPRKLSQRFAAVCLSTAVVFFLSGFMILGDAPHYVIHKLIYSSRAF